MAKRHGVLRAKDHAEVWIFKPQICAELALPSNSTKVDNPQISERDFVTARITTPTKKIPVYAFYKQH